MTNKSKTVRYTATLPEEYIYELRELAKDEKIPSVNYAVNEALGAYLKQTKKEQFEEQMKEAAQDKAFLKRTLNCEDDFKYANSEVGREW
ncbi:MAG: hypothetical protein WC677_01360 [Clostridia bacterium]|jgi:metal-responsive CopG/Arc/MetJ family transcriptional regulator